MLAVVLMFTTCVSCDKDNSGKTSGENKKTQQNVSSQDKTEKTDGISSDNTADTPSTNNSSITTSNNNSSTTTSKDTTNSSVINDKNYDGKTFTLCLYNIPNESFKATVAEFNKKHNANVEIKLVLSLGEDVAKSISSGKPFDIVGYVPEWYSPKFMENNFESLNGYISDSDYSKDKGINKTATDMFTYKGNIYSAVSSYSLSPYVIYYNKQLQKDCYGTIKPHDPYELWRNSEWTFEKMQQLSHAGGLNYTNIKVWLDIRGVSAVSRNGDSFSSGLKTATVKSVLNSYRDMFYGSKPMMSNYATEFNARSSKSPTVYRIGTVEEYEKILQGSNNMTIDDLKVDNVGVVPLPEGMYQSGKYPAKIARAYSSAKGASDPSVAACFALFEGKNGNNSTMPREIYDAVYYSFNNLGGFVGYNYGYQCEESSGDNFIRGVGKMIAQGVPVDEAVNEINDSLTEAVNNNL